MGKRLQRMNGTSIPQKAKELLHKEVHLVMKDNSIFHGVICLLTETSCQFKDYRSQKHIFSISDIAEVITDQTTAY